MMMKWQKLQRRLTFACALGLVTASLAGCGGGNEEPAPAASSPTPKEQQGGEPVQAEPLELSWTAILYTPQPPKDTIIKMIEEKTNTKLNITWVPDAVKEDKLNTALASNTLTKVMTIQDIKNSAFLNAVRAGMFWELGPYLKDYPNLSEMNPTILENISIDGKVYGIYRERPLSRQGVVVRKDWLEQVGLESPTTIDEFYEVLKAFTLNDPDNNGNNDTFGLTDRNDLKFGAFKTLSSYFGTPNEWGLQDGKLMPEFMSDGYMETMKFMKKLYDEKLMNDDFAVTSKNQQWEKFTNGDAGVYIGNMVDAKNLYNTAVKINPDIELDIINRIAGPDGEHRVWSQAGHNGIFAIPVTAVKTEEEVKQILAFFDQLAEAEMWDLMNLGIEGTHYTKMSDGYYQQNEDAAELRENEVRALNSLVAIETSTLKPYEDPLREKYEELTLDNLDIIVPNPAEALDSQTFIERGNELKKLIDDATYKFILGSIDEAGFQAEVEKWRNSGGDKIIEEYNEHYNASK